MMKSVYLLFLGLIASALLFAGCGGGEESTSAETAEGEVVVETSKLESAFADASGEVKQVADKAVSALKSTDYEGALASLQNMASNFELSAEQKSAISDINEQVKTKLAEYAAVAKEKVEEAVGDAPEKARELLDNLGGNNN